MKAATIKDYGTPVEISEVAMPKLLDDSVLIKVNSASVNPIDNMIIAGYMKENLKLTFPYIPGLDISGVVEEVGKDVKKFKKGDEVFSRPNTMQAGTIAEYTVVKEAELAMKPSNISHNEAASIPLAGLTAWQALVAKGNLTKGQKVLIHAGSGGVGTLAIQIAKHIGAYIATTASKENFELVKNLGADTIIDFKTQKFENELKDYDLVFDMIGGEVLENSFKILKKGGCLVSIKGMDTKGLASQYGVRFEAFYMWPSGDMLTQLAELIKSGNLKPIIDKVYTFEKTQDAFTYLRSGHAKGKIVIQIN